MKQKLPAILFLISTGFSVVVYLKVAELSGHELLGVVAAMGFYMAVFAVLCVLFNTKEESGRKVNLAGTEGTAGSDPQGLGRGILQKVRRKEQRKRQGRKFLNSMVGMVLALTGTCCF